MKIEGEDINPRLEVDMTWTIDGIEIRERPDDEKHPWAGAVDITIISKIKELDGYITEETKKTFRYVWDMEIQKWVIE